VSNWCGCFWWGSADPGDDELAESQWTERGYTGHEHLDKVKLIHMNGRVQDPILGRMLSADPMLGDLTDPQSLNRYSYVRNNPLGLTDPSGFDAQEDEKISCCIIIVTTGPERDTSGLESYFLYESAQGVLDAWIGASVGVAQAQLDAQVSQEPTPVLPLTRGEQDLLRGLAQSIRNVGPGGRVIAGGGTKSAYLRGLGIWNRNTPTEIWLLKQGNYVGYYESRVARGMRYERMALDVVHNRGLMGRAANQWLAMQYGFLLKTNPSHPIGVGSYDDFRQSVSLELARAHADAVDRDRSGVWGLLSQRQITDYHERFFVGTGLPAMTFGGSVYATTPLGRVWPDWCGSACDSVP